MTIEDLVLKSKALNFSSGSTGSLSEIKGFFSIGFVNDLYTGGGIPMGKTTIMTGKYGGGKTTACYHAAKSCQEQSGLVIWLASEASWNPGKAKDIGVNTEDVVLTHPESLEAGFKLMYTVAKDVKKFKGKLKDLQDTEASYLDEIKTLKKKLQGQQKRKAPSFNTINETIDTIKKYQSLLAINRFRIRMREQDNDKLPILIVWDSITASGSEDDIKAKMKLASGGSQKEADQQKYAKGMMNRPRVIGDNMTSTIVPFARENITVILVAMISQGPGTGGMFQPQYTFSGGNKMKHVTWLVLDFIPKKKEAVGQWTRIRSMKNKTVKPGLAWDAFQYYTHGFNEVYDVYYLAKSKDVIVNGKLGWETDILYKETESFGWKKEQGDGFEGFFYWCQNNPEYYTELKGRLKTIIFEEITQFTPPEIDENTGLVKI